MPTKNRLLTNVPARLGLIGITLLLVTSCSTQPIAEQKGKGEADQSIQSASKHLVIAAVGDIMLDGSAREIMQEQGYDYAFDKMRPWLQKADIAFGNLEGPLTDRGEPATDKKYLFRSPPAKVAEALKGAGFDIVSLANNHSLDYGSVGLADTIAALDKVGVHHVGAGENLAMARQAAILQRNGLKVAFLAYSLTFPEEFWATANRAGTVFGYREIVEGDIRAAKQKADIVVASFHWGQESKTELRPYQVALGHAAINAGASLVIGHHPHILQSVERYKDGVILYSMGNFAFGSYSPNAKVSALAEIEFNGNKLTQVRLQPINVFNIQVLFQPQPLVGEAAANVISHLQKLSSMRETSLVKVNDTAMLELPSTIHTASNTSN
jgi:poly-gamma-glutamate capsule biosynthesis protein CapA/YwtB (metallophosphatase superfamily)